MWQFNRQGVLDTRVAPFNPLNLLMDNAQWSSLFFEETNHLNNYGVQILLENNLHKHTITAEWHQNMTVLRQRTYVDSLLGFFIWRVVERPVRFCCDSVFAPRAPAQSLISTWTYFILFCKYIGQKVYSNGGVIILIIFFRINNHIYVKTRVFYVSTGCLLSGNSSNV